MTNPVSETGEDRAHRPADDRAGRASPEPQEGLGHSATIPCAARRVEQRATINDPRDDYDFSPGAGMLRMAQHDSAVDTWWSGDFVDYRGIVTIQMEQNYTRLDTVAGGRCHVRTWQRAIADRTVGKLCRAFLTELHGAPGSDQ